MSGSESPHSLNFRWDCQLSLRKQVQDVSFCFSKSEWIPLCTMRCWVGKSSLSHFASYLKPFRQITRQYVKIGCCLFTVFFISRILCFCIHETEECGTEIHHHELFRCLDVLLRNLLQCLTFRSCLWQAAMNNTRDFLQSILQITWLYLVLDHNRIPWKLVILISLLTASVVWWSEFLATDPEVPGSIPGAHSLVSKNEKLLEWKSSSSGSTALGIRCSDHATPSVRKWGH
jgi:hypothetical protein